MTLLKNSKPIKKRTAQFSIADGWNFGIGFGLAMTIAIPIILALVSCIAFMFLGNTLSTLLGF